VRRSIDAALAATSDVVLVGPHPGSLPPGVRVVREEPPHSGPYAAVARGLDELADDVEVVLVLAGDLRDPAPAVPLLLDAVAAGAEAAVAVDDQHRRQPLLAAYRVRPLRGGILGVDPTGRAAGELLDGLHVVEVHVPPHATRDVDVPDDLR
jgi:molybdopterin-guanine dinucleotide biosynthesis protein A